MVYDIAFIMRYIQRVNYNNISHNTWHMPYKSVTWKINIDASRQNYDKIQAQDPWLQLLSKLGNFLLRDILVISLPNQLTS